MPRSSKRWLMHVGDFANMFKAFIGSNYLGVAYAFKQSGVVLGAIVLVFIALLTDHCCALIVKAKHSAIDKIISDFKKKKQLSSGVDDEEDDEDKGKSSKCFNPYDSESSLASTVSVETEDDIESLRKYMMQRMSYGDVGRMSLGKFGIVLVNIFIATTQFCFCVAYFIFIGNTIYGLFPEELKCPDGGITSTAYPISSSSSSPITSSTSGTMLFPNESVHLLTNNSQFVNDSFSTNRTMLSNEAQDIQNIHVGSLFLSENTSAVTISNSSTDLTTDPSNFSSTTEPMPENITARLICTEESTLPKYFLKYFVAAPLPLFLVFALIRSIRKMSWISVIANVSILGGCVTVFFYLIINFKYNRDSFDLFKIDGLPLFFGMVTAAFEGIGLVIPVESSMEGNRHNFRRFLFGAVGGLALILCVFGVFGYMSFGSEVEQMINLNIQRNTWVYFLVNIGVCVGVLLTFPLQIYPVIELFEIMLFSDGSICGPKPKSSSLLNSSSDSGSDDEGESLLPDTMKHVPVTVAVHIPETVPTWKRNILRVLVVFVAAGLAVLFRDNFAYIGGFTGALGSSFLAYILPCLFHILLCRSQVGKLTITKDCIIIVLGLCASVVSLWSVLLSLIKNTKV